MFFVIPGRPSKTFVMVLKKIPDHFKNMPLIIPLIIGGITWKKNAKTSSFIYFSLRFLNPLNVTKVSPSDDIEGINNFDIFVIQEGAKTSGKPRNQQSVG